MIEMYKTSRILGNNDKKNEEVKGKFSNIKAVISLIFN